MKEKKELGTNLRITASQTESNSRMIPVKIPARENMWKIQALVSIGARILTISKQVKDEIENKMREKQTT